MALPSLDPVIVFIADRDAVHAARRTALLGALHGDATRAAYGHRPRRFRDLLRALLTPDER